MANSYFQFKQFIIHQDRCAMKVTTDACLFGAWVAGEIQCGPKPLQQMLDIGTGTGMLSLMIAQKNPELNIDAIDIDSEAARQADENRVASPWSNRLNIIEGDARNLSADKMYDVLVSNPPFYENELQSVQPKKNVAHHSSELTFDDLFRLINDHLQLTGTFYLLLPYKRKEEIKRSMRAQNLFVLKEVYVRQSAHHDFFRIMIAGKKEVSLETQQSEISIRDEKQHYSDDFIKYLGDFYLHL